MKKEDIQSIINALEEALSLISNEYGSLQDEDLQQEYVGVIEKLQNAIKKAKNYD
jgi:hypothetical protein